MAKSQTENFLDPEGPLYRADHAGDRALTDGTLTVASWNIQFAREVPAAIAELKGEEPLAAAGILLLQEMDEHGVDDLARALSYNYVYYPASIHCRTGRMFGNAVLARGRIVSCGKVMLPHSSPRTGEIRIAAKALVEASSEEVLVYSLHTETPALRQARRREQVLALVDDIGQTERRRVIAGGDFNTLTGRDVRMLDEVFGSAGLGRATAGATLKVGFLSFSMDHVFTRGMRVVEKGIGERARASDHLPVWSRLALVGE